MSRSNPTIYLDEAYYDLSSEEEVTKVTKVDQAVNTEDVQPPESSSMIVDFVLKSQNKNVENTYIDNQTQHETIEPITTETQTDTSQFFKENPSLICHVCGGKTDAADNCVILEKNNDVDILPENEPEMSSSLIEFCSSRPRNQLIKKNIKAIKSVALKLLDICENPNESDEENNARIMKTLSKNLKTLRSNDPTVCVPVIIKLDKRMAAGEGGPNSLLHKSSHSDKSIRFSISRDFADDILDDMENEMSTHLRYRKSGYRQKLPSSESDEAQEIGNVAEKPLTNSSPKESFTDFIHGKLPLHDKNNLSRIYSQEQPQHVNIPEIARNIRKLLKEKNGVKEKYNKATKEKTSKKTEHLSTCSSPSVTQTKLISEDPIELAISINSSRKRKNLIPNMGMCSCAISNGNTDLVCPFTEQTRCDCLVKLPSFLSKNDFDGTSYK